MSETKHSRLSPGLEIRLRQLTEIDQANEMKAAEERILRRLDELAAGADIDKRWLAIGRTAIEQGFMAVNRSIFRPGRASLLEDTSC